MRMSAENNTLWIYCGQRGGAHPVKVCLRVLGEVEVDNNIYSLDVNAACEEVCRRQALSALVPVWHNQYLPRSQHRSDC